jgi:hypothetical protein
LSRFLFYTAEAAGGATGDYIGSARKGMTACDTRVPSGQDERGPADISLRSKTAYLRYPRFAVLSPLRYESGKPITLRVCWLMAMPNEAGAALPCPFRQAFLHFHLPVISQSKSTLYKWNISQETVLPGLSARS